MEEALAIENRRRSARGEEPLASLDEETADGEEVDPDAEAQETADASDLDERDDVLLTEAGNILIDTLLMREQAYAANAKKDD